MSINVRELIVAVDPYGSIGANDNLGFDEPQDMAWFKWYTTGKTVVAGRKTAESFGYHPTNNPQPLPGRKLIVLSSTGESLADVLLRNESLCFIGGGEIYKQVLPHVHRAVVTHLETVINNADTSFDTGYLIKRFDKWVTVKSWDTARITIYEHIKR
jgi:dihydrofolate reductase